MPDLVRWLVEHEPEFSEKRLPSLYADLAQQKWSNPDGFSVNAAAWEKALTRAALAAQLPTEQKIILRVSDDLLHALRSPQYGQPTGLGAVIDRAVARGTMMNLRDFLSTDVSIYQKSWVPSLGTLVKWSLRQAGLWNSGSYEQNGHLKRGDLLLIKDLEMLAKEVLERQAAKGGALTDRVISWDMFSQLLAQTSVGPLSDKETGVLLRYLSRDKQALIFDVHVIKFSAVSAEKPEPISNEDTNIVSIKALMSSLDTQIKSLNQKIANLQNTTSAAVQSKNRNAALSAIRSRKLAEKTLEQRSDTLYKLEEVYSKIEQAADQVQVVEAMQASSQTLKSLNQRVGGVDRVDAIMDDLREQMSQADEVGQVLQEPLNSKVVLDESEIDDELVALEKEESVRKEKLDESVVRAKLAELESAERAAKSTATAQAEKEVSDTALELELESSSQRLDRMRLGDENRPQTTPSAERKQQAEIPAT